MQAAGRLEIMVGWYHSHPGYGCWLSGIDCSTQMMQQQYQDPFLAIVVDPHRTIASGKVEIGAFRTYPEVRAWQPFPLLPALCRLAEPFERGRKPCRHAASLACRRTKGPCMSPGQ